MSDVALNVTSEGTSGTEIQAQDGFNQDYVFQGNSNGQFGPTGGVDGLRGLGSGTGAGVRGEGGTGVWGKGLDGVFGEGGTGVRGRGSIGVLGEGTGNDSTGVSATGSTGVSATGDDTGVSASSTNGPAVDARSTKDRGGVFQGADEPNPMAQVRLIPSRTNNIPPDGEKGDLYAVPSTQLPGQGIHLFLCVKGSKLSAEWREIQLGGTFLPGQAV
jgi:hypothetical protein